MMRYEIDTVIGVELNIIADNTFSCRFCKVSKQKNSINIHFSKVTEGTLSSILEALPKTYPIALTLTGKGLINKNIPIIAETSLSQTFQNSFPSIDESEFYIQCFNQNENGLISAVRRSVMDELLDKMKRAGLNIAIITLSAIVSAPVLQQLNIIAEEVNFDGHTFNLNLAHEFLAYKKGEVSEQAYTIKIDQEIISAQNIVAYASAFQLLLYKKDAPISANVHYINQAFSNFLENNRLKAIAILLLFLLFGTLLISYGVFSYYNDKNAILSEKLGTLSSNTDQIDVLRKNSAKDEALLKQLNWNQGFNYGFLMNEIGQSMPKQLQLLEITMNDFKTEAEKSTRTPQIKISGITNNLSSLNNWLYVLKQKSWVKVVRLLKYEEDTNDEYYKFNLILTY